MKPAVKLEKDGHVNLFIWRDPEPSGPWFCWCEGLTKSCGPAASFEAALKLADEANVPVPRWIDFALPKKNFIKKK